MRTHRAATVGLVCLTAVLSTGAGPLRAQPPSPGEGVIVDEYTKTRLGENALTRTIDTCALLDPGSVKEIFGAPPRVISLNGFDRCSMTVEPTGDSLRSWSISVNTGFTTVTKTDNAETLDLHGRTFARRKDRELPGLVDFRCTWALLSDGQGTPTVELGVDWHGMKNEPPPKPQCDLAKAYLPKVAPYLITPSRRGEGASKPELTLPTKDPCVAMPELAKRFGKPGQQPKMTSVSPFSCTLALSAYDPRSRERPEEIEVSFRWADNPAHKAANPVTIGGKPGNMAERGIDKKCQVDLQYDPTMVPERYATEPDGRDVQTITVVAKTCDVAQPAAELAVKGAR
ncbi:hypothetical protein [Allokutzneria albata]|uniref:Uncharacterized protein n=1 Tax=Allokutzneria albata TaxID=211114 RepID=A0A1G9QX67_ALLAB|nr:hypothetical protein [Allokutzneria albata]SDM15197.1 hypothetical protein SAMN04489726_0040 [Allokutzneria albata]